LLLNINELTEHIIFFLRDNFLLKHKKKILNVGENVQYLKNKSSNQVKKV
jgi:hypothetical protein